MLVLGRPEEASSEDTNSDAHKEEPSRQKVKEAGWAKDGGSTENDILGVKILKF